VIYAIFKCRQCGQKFKRLEATCEYPNKAALRLEGNISTHECAYDNNWATCPVGIADVIGVIEDE